MKLRTTRAYGVRRQSGAATPFFSPSLCAQKRRVASLGFTLVELILVMALLVVAVSFITPRLGGFFRGRTLNSEARQLGSLIHSGQSRAVSGGVPMTLWFDTDKKTYGLEEEPGYADNDPDAVQFQLDENLHVEVPDNDSTASMSASNEGPHAGMPQITFLPDGTIAESSPQTIRIIDSEGPTLSLKQTRDRNDYEITTTTSQ